MRNEGLAAWHRVVAEGNPPEELTKLLAEDAVFHSPVVHTPQVGRDKVIAYLSAAGLVFGAPGGPQKFTYVRELVDGHEVCLEFTAELDGVKINGVDLIAFDLDWKIRDFKVMVRPLKAINLLHRLMGEQLAAMSKPS